MQVHPKDDRIKTFCQRWGVQELSVFGSVLRDDFRPNSDVDVLISFAPDRDWDYWDWPEILDELRDIFGREVDLVVKEALRNPFRRHRILTEREVLHAA
jgi:predicted nucleotidyltransferase